ncbi:hypothetical protein B0T17DRAFT_498016 [Bombardia bombarda]|uniref:Uncharacterized protein n=1 Tax=Bombardia bombarda TaxID=252184 RepID=A0AA39WGP1_9PEZI|nr:hypothetical protein B0T17DRAFT_498016 [Bombardia bombarda]
MAAVCKACNEPLTLTIQQEGSAEEGQQQQQEPTTTTVPDDLELPCSCHFHWQCLHDQAPAVTSTLKCPSCSTHLSGTTASSSSSEEPTSASPILATYTSEGGVESGLDIFPSLSEEAFIFAHPEALPARALHTMVAMGDVASMVELMDTVDADTVTDITTAKLLPWTDPQAGGQSALHVAIECQQASVFWLLLWVGSTLPASVFFPGAAQAAEGMGLRRRDDIPRDVDVRYVKDAQGRLPADLCREAGLPWSRYVEGGLFK